MDSEPGISSFTPVETPSGANTGLFLSIAIGLAGILLGAIAIYMVYSGNNKAVEAENALKETAGKAAEAESRIQAIEAKIDKILSDQSAADRLIKNLASQSQAALNQVGQEISTTRQLINEANTRIKELGEKLAETRTAAIAPPVAATANTSANTNTPSQQPSGIREHVITSGDTFARLATLYNVSVDQILAANPDADPRRLQLGQRIKIPHGSHNKED